MARRRFKTMEDVRRYVGNVLDRLEDKKLDEAGAKARVYCANVLASIIKDSDLEQRLDVLERQMEASHVRQ